MGLPMVTGSPGRTSRGRGDHRRLGRAVGVEDATVAGATQRCDDGRRQRLAAEQDEAQVRRRRS